MVSYNYFRILINFHLLLYLMGVHKIRFIADHFYLSFNFTLSNSINCGTGINHSQVTIFINLMSWYCWSIITGAEGLPRVDYPIAFDRLLTKIRQLEEEHVKLVSRLDLNTNKLVEGEFELLSRRSKLLTRQENYAIAFAVVAKKMYGVDYLDKVTKSHFQIFILKVCIILAPLKVILSDLFLIVLIVCKVTTRNEKDCVNLNK